jgi:PAS domain S-box-containing protein
MKNIKLLSSFQLYALIGLTIVFIIDLFIPLGVAIGVMYLCCFTFIIGENRKTIIAFTIFSILLILLKPLIYFSIQEINLVILTNRLISIVAIFTTSLLALKYRKQKERKKELQELLYAYQQAINQNIISCVTDLKGNIVSANQKFCDVSKYTEDELKGKSNRIVNSGHHPKEYFNNLWSTISSGDVWRGEIRNKAKDGSIYWVNSTILPIKNENGDNLQFLALQTDITKRKQLEHESISLREQLIIIQETERMRIAQELHDGILQMLAASNMQINALKETCNDHNEGTISLNNLGSLVVDSLKEARSISHNLSCKAIQLGLDTGLRKNIESLNSKCKIILESNISEKRFPEKIEINIYRVLQEIINNTIKHAKATELKIIINQKNNSLFINTIDNGVGFDIKQSKQKIGLGLSSLKHRIEMIDGTIEIKTAINKGVEFNIVIDNIQKLNVA